MDIDYQSRKVTDSGFDDDIYARKYTHTAGGDYYGDHDNDVRIVYNSDAEYDEEIIGDDHDIMTPKDIYIE
eukprot:CAMPEP_0201589082 /NCGR_PEP_ID=MMETSP0190_2-20130828/162594_1 /ASSEMBLY_ACC=CAM_ASM_000263 /TAXON_ID=37353 /ORGANISM="Rosalina sp." /LENGTH=70 /DNA_ID=CAMNT_0048042519 /DNA_START=16 /DNA_END=226 /DNA_ORIENTATION=+